MKKTHPHRYWVLVTILMLLALGMGGFALASAWQLKAVEGPAGLLDLKPYEALYLAVVTGVLVLLGAVVYFLGLNPYASRRPRLLVFLNLWAPWLYLGLGLVAMDWGLHATLTIVSQAFAPAAGLLPPFVFLMLEAVCCSMLRALGHNCQDRGWRRTAMAFFMMNLAFRPEDKELRKRCGLLYVEDEECARGLPLLEALGPLESLADEDTLKAMEHCHRAQGNVREALRVLQRLHQVRPDQAWVERRILDDFVRLEMHREALDLLEAGRLKMNLDLLQLSEKLNLALGNYAQAMALIRRIAGEEGPPNALAIRLYREMLQKLPDFVEVRINLGLLLLENDNEELRREGTALLEDVLAREGHRLHLARRLVQFHTESNQPREARKFLKMLVQAGDPDPEYHLAYAQALIEDAQHEEAVSVLQAIVKRWPEDWRGHLKLARAFLQLEMLEEAERQLETTRAVAPEEAQSVIEPVGAALEQRKRQKMVHSMREDVARQNVDVEKRLELVDHQIEMEWIDEALAECDRLIDESPALLPVVAARIEKGIQRVPRSYSLRDYLSDIYFQQGRYDETLQLYREMAEQSLHPTQVISDGCRRILDRAPGHMEARRELALARRKEEDWPGVLEALDPPVHNNTPIPPEDKVLWVEAAYRLWRLDGAVRVGLTLVDDLIEEVGFLIMMLDILMDAKEFDKALELYKKARAAHPDDRKLARLESKVVSARSRHRMSQLQRQMQIEGDLSEQEHYEKAELHCLLGQNEEAIVHYQRAAYDPKIMPLATAKLAETLCDRGMFDLADETLNPLELTRDLIESHPELKDMMYRVGRQLERIRYYDKAVKYYKRVFRIDASYEDVVERIDRLT